METLKLKTGNYILLLVILGVSLAVVEYAGLVENRGALLLTLAFWSCLIQGSIAAVAATETIQGKWISTLRRELLSVYPLLLFLALAFLLLWPRTVIYPWHDHPNFWLNSTFFMLRNFIVLLAVFISARLYVIRSLRGDPSRVKYAIIYLSVFTLSQFLIAFDWIMTLEYPWFSSLFGFYFLVEAMFAGLALATLNLFFQYRFKFQQDPAATTRHQEDLGRLMLGFSVLWGGFFFAQFLLIWYGNIPEEANYIAKRIVDPYTGLSYVFIVLTFLVPFLVLIPRWCKRNIFVLSLVAASVLTGLFLEKVLFILPDVKLHLGIVVLEIFLVLPVWLLTIHSRSFLLPQQKPSWPDK